ncbi:MAG: hypothetical protein ACOC1X_02565 [Promethearchaeota archaeon]
MTKDEPSPENCPLCQHDDSDGLAEEIAEGLPKQIVSEELDCSIEEINHHMENHFGATGVTRAEASSGSSDDLLVSYRKRDSYDKFDILEKNMIRLTDRFDGLMQKDAWEPQDTSQIVKMAQEIRRTATAMAELEQEIKQELRMTEKQFEDFKSAILRELDEESQKKIIDVLEEEVEIELEAER